MSTNTNHQGFVNATCFDEAGQRLLSCSIEGKVSVWHIDTLTLASRLSLHTGPINDLAWANGLVTTAGFDGRVKVADMNANVLRQYDLNCPVHAVADAGERIYAGGADANIYRFEDEHPVVMGHHSDAIECLAAADGLLLAGSRDRTISVWNTSSQARVAILSGHEDWVTQVAHVAENRAISVGEDGLAILWDLANGRELWRIDTGSPAWGLAVNQQLQKAYVGKAGKPLTVDLQKRTTQDIEDARGFAARAISVSPAGLVALGHDAGGIDLLEPGAQSPGRRLLGNHQGILSAAFTNSGCLAGHQSGQVSFLHATEKPVICEAHNHMAYASQSIGSNQVAVGGLDGHISVWDAHSHTKTDDLFHNGQVFALDWASNTNTLLSAGEDKWILWDPNNWNKLHVQAGLGSGNHTLASINDDGNLVVSVGENQTLAVWRQNKLTASHALPHQDSSAVTLSPDASHTYIAFNDGIVGVVNLTSGAYKELHRVHDSWIRQLIASPDGNTLWSCSQNGIAVACELSTGQTTILGTAPIAALNITPGGLLGLVTCTGELILQR